MRNSSIVWLFVTQDCLSVFSVCSGVSLKYVYQRTEGAGRHDGVTGWFFRPVLIICTALYLRKGAHVHRPDNVQTGNMASWRRSAQEDVSLSKII